MLKKPQSLLHILINIEHVNNYYGNKLLCPICMKEYDNENLRINELEYNGEILELEHCLDCNLYIINNKYKLIKDTYKCYFSHCIDCMTEKRIKPSHTHYNELLDEMNKYNLIKDMMCDMGYDVNRQTKRILLYILCDKCINAYHVKNYNEEED